MTGVVLAGALESGLAFADGAAIGAGVSLLLSQAASISSAAAARPTKMTGFIGRFLTMIARQCEWWIIARLAGERRYL
jgi:hypothetical protein